MKFIYCGDVVARAGREAVLGNLEKLKDQFKPDFIIANVENAAHGFGATPGICRDFLEKGVDGLVMGNHTWQQRELIPFLDECKKIIRPLNYPEGLPGKGFMILENERGKKLLVIQVLGRMFMEAVDSPTRTIDNVLKNYAIGKNVDAILVDIHAEATSEKLSLGCYLDGRVSAVIGTHTHVPTDDAKIWNGGTAYMTDVGMCGDYNSVIGFDKEEPVNRLVQKYNGGRLTPAKGKGTMRAVLVETDDQTGLAVHIEKIEM